MLAKFQTVLRQAQRGGYAVGAFNVSNLEHIQAVIWAATNLRAPVIVNVSEKAMAHGGVEELSAITRQLAKRTKSPIVLGLDHGRHLRAVETCLQSGFTGIMFDSSTSGYAVNVRRTAAAVRAAKRFGIGVEGELGQVKYPKDLKKSPRLVMTDPTQAADYVRQTGISALAVAIGNSHVIPGDILDFHLLRVIRQRVRVPLVLHGSSGTAPAAIRRAVRMGIAKINIDTDLRHAFTDGVRQILAADKKTYDPRSYLAAARSKMQQEIEKKITLFGSKGRVR